MLTTVVLVGLAVFFAIEIIRKLPVLRVWALAGKKPWGCDQCMSFWISGMACIYLWVTDMLVVWEQLVLVGAASAGVSLSLLLWTSSLLPADPPELP